MSIRFACPTCSAVINAPDDKVGSKVECPQCKQRLQVPALLPPQGTDKTVLGQQLPDPAPPASPVPMAAPVPAVPVAPPVVTCPHCRGAVGFDASLLGVPVACPHCKSHFQFGGAPPPAAKPVQPVPDVPTLTAAEAISTRSTGRNPLDVLGEVSEPAARRYPGAGKPHRIRRGDEDDYDYDYPRRRRYDREDGGAVHGLGVAGFVCGLLAVVFIVVPCLWVVVVLPLGLVGLILSAVSCSRSGFGVAGLVLSLIALAVVLFLFVAVADVAYRRTIW